MLYGLMFHSGLCSIRGGQRAPRSMLMFSHPGLLLSRPAGCDPWPPEPHSWPLGSFPRHTVLYSHRCTVTDGNNFIERRGGQSAQTLFSNRHVVPQRFWSWDLTSLQVTNSHFFDKPMFRSWKLKHKPDKMAYVLLCCLRHGRYHQNIYHSINHTLKNEGASKVSSWRCHRRTIFGCTKNHFFLTFL